MTTLLTPQSIQDTTESIIKMMYEIIPTEISRRKVSEWAEECRVLPEGLTPYPGPYSFDINPYMREIADFFADASPGREGAVMKGTQIMYTVGALENDLGFTIDVEPAPLLYVTGDAGLADTQMELRVDAMINSSGLAHKIGSQSKRVGQRKTGDVKTRKEFPGGFLVAAGPNSGAKLRSMSFKKILVDEVDAFPDSTGKEGDPVYLIRRRTDAFSESSKIIWGSTPLFEHNSKIKKLFEEGDQRKYFVPCKHCGHMQFLKWGKKGEPGLHFDHDEDDRLIEGSVHYECEKCGGHWVNADKDFFLPDKSMGGKAEWRPTATPRRPDMFSWHIPGLYSPRGFRSWELAVTEFLQIKHEGFPKLKFQNWINTFLGEPFEDRGERPRIEAILTRKKDYHVDTLPEGAKPLFVTIGADIQADRIECEVVAWGKDFESWSINYHVIPGDTGDEFSECWEAMRSVIKKEYCGMKSVLTGIDAGYNSPIVYSFCDTFDAGVHPVMGTETLDRGRTHIKLFAVADHRMPRVDINTDLMKSQVYSNLAKGEYESGGFPGGFCHFPVEYKKQHYLQLTAETPVYEVRGGISKKKWDAGGRRNEQLDCRGYALAMVYGYRQYIEESARENYEIEPDAPFEWSNFWEYLAVNH